MKMSAKRRAPPSEDAPPKARRSKIAKENNITAQEENEIKEAFGLFSVPASGEKEGVLPTKDIRKAMIALGVPPTGPELSEFLGILDPDTEGFAEYAPFVAICALKMHAKKGDSSAIEEEVEAAFRLFTNGADGPITVAHLKRVAAALKEDVDEDLLKDMILEANGGRGTGAGVDREEFEEVMRRAGIWR